MKVTTDWLRQTTLLDEKGSYLFSQRQIRFLTFWYPELVKGNDLKAGWFKELIGKEMTESHARIYANAKYASPDESVNQTKSRQWRMVEEEAKEYEKETGFPANIKRSCVKKIVDIGLIQDVHFEDDGDKMIIDFSVGDKMFSLMTAGTLFITLQLTYENQTVECLGKNLKTEVDKFINPQNHKKVIVIPKKKIVVVKKK